MNAAMNHIATTIANAQNPSQLSLDVVKGELRNAERMTQEVYIQLQLVGERLERQAAMGQDVYPEYQELRAEVDRLQNAAPWTMHPDYGPVLQKDVAALDAAAAAGAQRYHVIVRDGKGLTLEGRRFDLPDEAMKHFISLRRSKFGPDHGVGSYVALMDSQLVYDASYLFEGKSSYREQFAKDAGRELYEALEKHVQPRFAVQVRGQDGTVSSSFATDAVRDAMAEYIRASSSPAIHARLGAGAKVELVDGRDGTYNCTATLGEKWSLPQHHFSALGQGAFQGQFASVYSPLQLSVDTASALLGGAVDIGQPAKAETASGIPQWTRLLPLLPVSGSSPFWSWYGVPANPEKVDAAIRAELDRLAVVELEQMSKVPSGMLSDVRLDWGVAQALRLDRARDGTASWVLQGQHYGISGVSRSCESVFNPSANSDLAVRFMDMEGIGSRMVGEGHWVASTADGTVTASGPDSRTAGLRCIVIKHLGPVAEIPDYLAEISIENDPPVEEERAKRMARCLQPFTVIPKTEDGAQRSRRAAVDEIHSALRGMFGATHGPLSIAKENVRPDLWAEVQRTAAQVLVRNAGHTPATVASLMAEVSPAAVLLREQDELLEDLEGYVRQMDEYRQHAKSSTVAPSALSRIGDLSR